MKIIIDLQMEFINKQNEKLDNIWRSMEACNHAYIIEDKHDFIHPPKCVNDCGGFMSPQERIDVGLSEIKTF